MSKLKVGDRVYHKFNENKGVGKIIAAHGARFLVEFPEQFLYVNKIYGLFMTLGEWCYWHHEEELVKYCEESEMKFVPGEEVSLNEEKFTVDGVDNEQIYLLHNANRHCCAHVSELTFAPKKIGKFKVGDYARCEGKRVKVLGVSSIGDYVMYGVVAEDNSTLYSVAERYLSSLSATELLKEKETLAKQLTDSEASYALLKEKYDNLKSDYEQLESEHLLLKDKCTDDAECIESLSACNESLAKERDELKDTIRSLEVEFQKVKEENAYVKEMYESLLEKYKEVTKEPMVGDTVEVVDKEPIYKFYKGWLEDFAPNLSSRFISGDYPCNGEKGIVMAKGEHQHTNDMVYAVLIKGQIFLMDVKGIEKVDD